MLGKLYVRSGEKEIENIYPDVRLVPIWLSIQLSNCYSDPPPTIVFLYPSACTYRLLIRAQPKCLKRKLESNTAQKDKKKKKRIKPKITHFLRKLLLVTEGRNPLTLIASPQTHKQFIWHARTHTYAPSPSLQGGRKIEARLWVSSFLWDILLTLPEIYHVNLWEMLI